MKKIVNHEVHISETDLKLESGKFNILLGSTLSGKTSLMRLMAGLDRPSEGEIWFNGKNVTQLPIQERNVGMVYQQFINYPGFSVYENLASPLRVQNLKSSEIKDRVLQIARLMKLELLLNRKPNELSGGQQQRTALARALIKNASLVLLDEPLANLDYKLREELRDELPKLFASTGATIVYATTEPLEALLLEGNTAILYQGKVMQFGSTFETYQNPKNLETAVAFSEPPINLNQIIKKGKTFNLNKISWPVPARLIDYPDGKYTMGIRPHFLSLADLTPATKNHIRFSGSVRITEITGYETLVHFMSQENHWILQIRSIYPMTLGQPVDILMDITKCIYFDQKNQTI